MDVMRNSLSCCCSSVSSDASECVISCLMEKDSGQNTVLWHFSASGVCVCVSVTSATLFCTAAIPGRVYNEIILVMKVNQIRFSAQDDRSTRHRLKDIDKQTNSVYIR